MKDFAKDSPYALELHEAPAWWSLAPAGSIDDGVRLSELIMNERTDLEDLHRDRDQQRVSVEFILP